MYNQSTQKKIYIFLLFIISSFSPAAQSFAVKGTVTDANGNALEGATVLEKGKNNSTITDSKGVYQLNLSSQRAVLVISYTGHELSEVQVNNRPEIATAL